MGGGARGRVALALAAIAATLAAYGAGAVKDGLFDPARRAERAFIAQYLSENAPDEARDGAAERALAEAYWRRYPDVARNPAYGRGGRFGIDGAREHFERHGREEGRIWGRVRGPE